MDVKIKHLVDGIVALQNGTSAEEVTNRLEEIFNTCEVKVWKEDVHTPLPIYGKDGDACCDVYAKEIEYDEKKDRYIVHTGLHFALPKNYEMELRPRSSNTKTEYYIPNTPGTLDSGYRGELLVIFKSRTSENVLQAINHMGAAHKNAFTRNSQEYSDMATARDYYDEAKYRNIFPYNEGDRVCQLLIRKREIIKWKEVDFLEDLGETDRGEGGFGSTGK